MQIRRLKFVAFAIVVVAAVAVLFASPAFAKEPPVMQSGAGPLVAPKVVSPLAFATRLPQPPAEEEFLGRIDLPRNPALKPAEMPPQVGGIEDVSVMGDAAPHPDAPSLEVPFRRPLYPGIGFTGWIPPDCTLTCGPSHVLLIVNSHFQIFDKSGTAVTNLITMADWFSNVTIDQEFCFDPKVIYDPEQGRWVLLAMGADFDTGASSWLISVSQTSDPTGDWWVWRLDGTLDGSTPTSNWADYPGFGMDKSAVYLTANMFGPSQFSYVKLRILRKSELYSGGSLHWYDFWKLNDGSEYVFTVQPAMCYPMSTFNYLVTAYDDNGGHQLTLFKVTNPTSSKPKLTYKNLPVTAYNLPPDAKQKGGGLALNSGDARLLCAITRNGKLYTTHAIGWNWKSGTVDAVRWYEITLSSSPTVTQTGTYGADKFYYYYPALAPLSNGDLFVTFARSSQTEYAGTRVAGRRSSTATGQLGTSSLVTAGRANYAKLDSSNRNRWGDYFGIVVDPSDTTKAWLLGEYANSKTTWSTTFVKVGFNSSNR